MFVLFTCFVLSKNDNGLTKYQVSSKSKHTNLYLTGKKLPYDNYYNATKINV